MTGVLESSGDSVTLKLPSSKLHIVKPFVIVGGSPAVDFVFDIAVVAAGNEKSPQGIKYLLLPVIGKSGADQPFQGPGHRGSDGRRRRRPDRCYRGHRPAGRLGQQRPRG